MEQFADLLTIGGASGVSSGGAVWFIMQMKFKHLEEKIMDARKTAQRAHDRIDSLQCKRGQA